MPFYSLSLLHKWRKDTFVLSHYLDNMSLTLKAGWIRKGQQFSESIHSWKEKTIIIICWLAKHTWESIFITSTKKLPCLQIIIRIIISFYSKSCQLIHLPYTPHAFIRHNCMSSTMLLSSDQPAQCLLSFVFQRFAFFSPSPNHFNHSRQMVVLRDPGSTTGFVLAKSGSFFICFIQISCL